MRVVFRYLTLFVGVVATINGCNGLISSHFGTHRLRTVGAEELATDGFGDADYLEITDVIIGEAEVVNAPGMFFAPGTIQRPLFTKEQSRQFADGASVVPLAILWTKNNAPAASPENLFLPAGTVTTIRGLVAKPPITTDNATSWAADRISIDEPTPYLAYNQAPMAWYWNLLMLLGGLALAMLPEARRFNKNRQSNRIQA